MKTGMTISCVGHALAIGCALVAISAQPMEVPPVDSLPVQFISEKDFTQLTQGRQKRPEAEDRHAEAAGRQSRRAEVGRSAGAQGRRQAGNQDRLQQIEPAAEARHQARSEAGAESRQAAAAGIQARSDRRSFEERRREESAKAGRSSRRRKRPDVAEVRRQSGRAVARQARPAAADGVQRNDQRRGQSRRRVRRAGRADVAERDRRLARAHFELLEPAAGHRRQFQGLCRASRSVQAGRYAGAGAGPGRSHGIGAWVRRWPRAPSARCCCASLSPCSSPNITISGKTSSSNSILTNCSAADQDEFRHHDISTQTQSLL